ncbi:hypothetical protein [Klebsiella michiganensis]|uniref:hypothetical protein n=1 Tax=Klebsiella michiganensis TaxID=1134687 RepID=UPI001D0F087B|nr:hypothetical protein [Klebsiella michiganensis]
MKHYDRNVSKFRSVLRTALAHFFPCRKSYFFDASGYRVMRRESGENAGNGVTKKAARVTDGFLWLLQLINLDHKLSGSVLPFSDDKPA